MAIPMFSPRNGNLGLKIENFEISRNSEYMNFYVLRSFCKKIKIIHHKLSYSLRNLVVKWVIMHLIIIMDAMKFHILTQLH